MSPIKTLAAFMAEKRAAADRKEKRAEKRSWLPWGRKSAQESTGTGPGRPARRTHRVSDRKTLIARLDALWSVIVIMRHRKTFGPLCRICVCRPATLAYHIVPKQRGHSIRWDLEDGVGGCSTCNYGEVSNRSLYRDRHILLFGRQFV